MSAIAVAPVPFLSKGSRRRQPVVAPVASSRLPSSSGTSGSAPATALAPETTAGEGWKGLHREDSRGVDRLDAEAQLVERCLRGEQGAWDEMIAQYTRRVYGLCYRFTNRDGEAQELTQEVFFRVFRSLGSFRAGEGCFGVWLTRLTRNLLVDHYRRTKQERITDALDDKLGVLEERGALTSRTDSMLAGREAGELLGEALERLSPELRETVILRDLQELEYKEIAQVLGVPEGTVKSRLNRGRAELARVLRRRKVSV